MLTVTLSLMVFCQMSDLVIGTRLPLEVYEIPQTSPIATHQLQQQHQQQQQQVFEGNSNYLKQKSTDSAEQLDIRQPRQMMEMLQKQHQRSQNELLREQHMPTKILYQIGESEEDLPICAPNAVCSKIDLYETPWIERQCRCSDLNRIPNVILHHKDSYSRHEKFHSYYESEKLLQHKRLLDYNESSRKFESIHFKKLMQKLGAVYSDELDLDDVMLDDSTGGGGGVNGGADGDVDGDDSESAIGAFEIHDNEFPMPIVVHRGSSSGSGNIYKTGVVSSSSSAVASNRGTHMRHSGHSSHNGHRPKEIPFIGGCPSSLGIEDGHTIVDKTRHYKLCNPVHKLPVCRHFRDYTWTLTTSAETNVTEQIVHCRCPRNSVTYLTKREPQTDGINGYTYLFACSPLTRIRCQRKEPCKLFTVRKRQEFLDEVNINALCQCPKGHRCPSHHTNSGVIPGETYLEDNIQTYSGYCMAND
ncbi:protein giant-lens [Eupeodes corollae]|uniref:protein giant-lens n=1 Tax=Eupeodes corollae TaxID=290404 RepID=UPI0024907E1D|nr:protein giant-lens [Eupeodes corollae]